MKSNHKWIIGLAAGAGVAGLAYALWPKGKIPNSAVVTPFDKQKYMGVWHEIARLPNMIERNLRDVSEEYKLNPDGSIQVTTRAYHIEKNKPVEATGKMKVKGLQKVGKLEVAYFLPIYLDYNILSIDDEYRYALVSGNSLDHLWILSRDMTIPDNIKTAFLEKATALGFNAQQLKWMS
jgi:apolipoprotein D and lipocalin family protein